MPTEGKRRREWAGRSISILKQLLLELQILPRAVEADVPISCKVPSASGALEMFLCPFKDLDYQSLTQSAKIFHLETRNIKLGSMKSKFRSLSVSMQTVHCRSHIVIAPFTSEIAAARRA